MKRSKKCIEDFLEAQANFKVAQENFKNAKACFYAEMESMEEGHVSDSPYVFEDEEFTVKRVQKSVVKFDADALEKLLGKELSSDVIEKQYCITNFEGLKAYLKKCNVSPTEFKKFITVSKSVKVEELDRLESIGKVSLSQIKGSYSIEVQKPYFMVKKKKER